jgi:tight adherence protein C
MPIDGPALGAALLLVTAVIAAVAAGLAVLRGESVVARRLRTTAAADDPGAAAQEAGHVFAKGLAPFAKVAQPLDEEEQSRLRLQLTRAGLRTELAAQAFLASKVLLAVGLTLLFLWFNADRLEPLLAICMFALGYYAPAFWLSSRVKERQLAIERGLPDTLDLLVTCVESGLGLDAALQRVAGETKLAWRTLGEELELTFLEVKAGIPRVDAFRRLAHRTGVGELKLLAATLKQTEVFGTSVGLALRVQSEGIRLRHTQRAEELAGYASVRMALPLIMCILPAVFAIVVGPGILRIVRAFAPVLK